MRKPLMACVLVLLATFKWCDKPPATESKDFGPAHYIRRTNADTVIVFVHGVFGGSVGTWTDTKTGAYWPMLLRDDNTFKNTDLYVYSYDSPYLGTSYTIDELIENMRLIFDKDEIFSKHKSVVFLCHSMGGLVIRGFLKRYQTYATSVPLIFFFSTPTAGSHVTELARFLSRNPQLKGMLPAQSGAYVSELQHDWRALPTHVNSRCAYETLDTYGIRIVDEQSASALCDGPVDPIKANHIDIVKPSNQDDLSYVAFRQAYGAIPVVPSKNSLGDSTKTHPPSVGTVRTARSVEVDCGQVREDTTAIPPPIDLRPEQKLLDAVASLQEASNLKEQQVEARGLENQMAKVHYRLTGLDRPVSGDCPAKGYGVILVTFVVSQPADMTTAGFTPIDKDALVVALSGKSGTLAVSRVDRIPAIDKGRVVSPRETLVLRDQVSVRHVVGPVVEAR